MSKSQIFTSLILLGAVAALTSCAHETHAATGQASVPVQVRAPAVVERAESVSASGSVEGSETADVAFPGRDAKALAPGADIGRVHGAVRKPAGAAVIVPRPERRVLHLELHGPAQALAGGNRVAGKFPGFHWMGAS